MSSDYSDAPAERARSSLQRAVEDISRVVDRTVSDTLHDVADIATFTIIVAGVVIVGYLQGSASVVLAPPAALGLGSIVVLEAAMACVSLSGMFGLSGLAMGGQLATSQTANPPDDGGTVTAIVPVYGDASVLDRSVESLLTSRYADIEIAIVAEPDDDASIARAKTLAEHDRVELMINTRTPGTKAGAINYAAEVTDSEYLAIFDADERVDRRFVSAAVSELADADVVQGRTIPDPDGFIESLAYYESVVLGDLSQRLLSVFTGFTLAASRTVVMRRSAFETVGGYNPAMLTEDYAFAFDCYEARLDVTEHLRYASTMEAAHTLGDWWGQRKRWMTGYAQVLHRRLTECLSPRNYRTILAPLICAGSVFGNIFMLSLVSKALVLVVYGATTWLVYPGLTLLASALALRVYDARRGRLDGVGASWLLTPLILPAFSLVGIKAAVEYLFTWDGEWYSVAKGV